MGFIQAWTQKLKAAASALKTELVALAGAARDPRTPWFARVVAIAVVAYAVSPIDLIPDFIPVLGLLDDLLLVPAGLWLALRLVPKDVLDEHRAMVTADARLPGSQMAAVFIVLLWAGAGAGLLWLWLR